MLDINYIRDNADLVRQVSKAKNKDPQLVDLVLNLDDQRRNLTAKVQEIRSQKNKLNRTQVNKGKALKLELKKLEPELRQVEEQYFRTLKLIPNIYHPDTPLGKDERQNVVIDKWGTPRSFDFEVKDHMQLGESLGIIDTKMAAKITGARFYYLKGDAALLQFAIIQHVFSCLTNSNILKEIANKIGTDFPASAFVPVVPPVMISPQVFDRMDRLKPEDDRFYIESDDKYLIGSAEHTLGPLHMDQVIPEKNLPIRYIGYSTSFRREAGSYGKDTKGILRVHQFDKLEMESFTTSDIGQREQDFFVAIQEYLLRSLEIPYQKVLICTGDMGKPDYRQIDLECWIPSQQKYRETHTSDYMADYQARRLNTKVARKGGVSEFVHMNDATAFALGRIIIAILENNQQQDGSVTVPEVLTTYIKKSVITPLNN